MTERLQYPIQAAIDPETLDDPLRDEIQWFQPFSEPIRQLAGVAAAAAIIASTGMAPIDPEALGEGAGEVVTLDEFQPLSVPVLPLPIQQPDAFVTDPATLDALLRDEIQWLRPLSEPVLRRPSVAEIPSFFIDPEALGEPAADEIVTLDEFQPLSQPVQPRPIQQPEAFVSDPETLGEALRDEIQWWRPLSEPVLPISRHAALAASGAAPDDQQSIGEAAADTSTEWWQPWPDQIWPAPALHVSLQLYFVTDPETIGDAAIITTIGTSIDHITVYAATRATLGLSPATRGNVTIDTGE